MRCQACGDDAPTKYVSFHKNIGLLIVRLGSHVEGELCKRCINKYFWEFFLTNMVLGWWGMISFIMNPFLIINNIYYYVGALSLPSRQS